jgi:CRP-like cAMP-binding protein
MFAQIKNYYKNLLPELAEHEWQAIEKNLTIKRLKKGELLVKEGTICNNVSFINYGLLRFYMLVDGKEVSTGFFIENQYISSYESFLTRQPSHENIEVLEDAEVLELSYNQMQTLYYQYPIYQIFGRKMAEYLFIFVSQRTNALLVLSPEQRYQKLISTNSALLQRVPQYMLASYIGVTPEHLSRIRRKLSSS